MEEIFILSVSLFILFAIALVVEMVEDIINTYFPELPEKILKFWEDGEKED